MFINPVLELWIFFSFFICGFIFGTIFDFFRAIRRNIKMNTLAVSISDLLFWITVLSLCAFFVFSLNGGLLRAFVISAFFIGVLLYFLLISKVVFWLFYKIIEIICKFLHLFFKILLTPIEFSYKIILVCFFKLKNKFSSGVKE